MQEQGQLCKGSCEGQGQLCSGICIFVCMQWHLCCGIYVVAFVLRYLCTGIYVVGIYAMTFFSAFVQWHLKSSIFAAISMH